MAKLIISNVDDETVKALKRRAKGHGRSLEDELRHILTDAIRPSASVDLRTLAEQIAAMTPDVPQTDSVDLLREDRRR
jgi:plasmid stability protein